MSNKILVIVDGNTNIHDYEEVAKIISENVNPANDIYFSQGPMDVLDHACSKFAFGGKMCLDATSKADVRGQKADGNSQIQNIKSQFPEIISISDSLLKKGISVVFVSVKKNRENHIKELNEKLFTLKEFSAELEKDILNFNYSSQTNSYNLNENKELIINLCGSREFILKP